MKTLLLAATVAVVAATASVAPVLAADPQNAPPARTALSQNGSTAAAPRYEWQYHYVGHHPRYEGHWVLVK